ncbi:MAG: signal recognition particle-docking protein FtsY [Cyanobacteria bacterium J06635_15]
MTGFNWFSRQHDDASQQRVDDQAQPSVTETTDKSDSSGSDSASQMSPEEYLQWAKKAYQNIQQRQQDSQPEVEFEATVATPTAALPKPDLPESKPVEPTAAEPETPESEQADAATAIADEIATDLVPGVSESGVTNLDTEASDVTASDAAELERVESTAESARVEAPETLPFWAQAEAERQARLARLQETAIAEPAPEPEPESTATTLTAPAIPDFVLDEAFMWSAEVLAAQGRRADDISIEEITWLNRLRQGLDKTRRSLVNQLKSIVGQGPLNEDAVMEIEALLLQADVGVEATDHIIETLQTKLKEQALPPDEAIAYLKSILRELLDSPLQGEHNLTFTPEKDQLSIWLMTGVNGAGKTTTIGKLAHIATKSGYNCLIAAADTFRAAAVEQVKVWGQRSNVEVIANPGKNTDPAAVVFDAVSAAKSRGVELLLVDTAGRLQNKKNLMDELAKVRRIIDKKAADAKVESLLVLDATLGQNGLRQAQVFSEAAQLSGVVLTKLDGTAKGGVALAVVQQLGLPIRFIGAGEGIEDLRPFSSFEFVEALLSD